MYRDTTSVPSCLTQGGSDPQPIPGLYSKGGFVIDETLRVAYSHEYPTHSYRNSPVENGGVFAYVLLVWRTGRS